MCDYMAAPLSLFSKRGLARGPCYISTNRAPREGIAIITGHAQGVRIHLRDLAGWEGMEATCVSEG